MEKITKIFQSFGHQTALDCIQIALLVPQIFKGENLLLAQERTELNERNRETRVLLNALTSGTFVLAGPFACPCSESRH